MDTRRVLEVLGRLGLSDGKFLGTHYQQRCPYHEESGPSWRIRITGEKAGLHHCFGAETEILTFDGVKKIGNLAGGVHRILTTTSGGNGCWVEAPFLSFGEQSLLTVHLSRNGVEKTIRVTAGHRWFVRSKKGRKGLRVLTTEQLRTGHRLCSVSPPRSGTIKPSPWAIPHGFVFGDGTLTRYGTKVTLWGAKDEALIEFFPFSKGRKVTTPKGVDGLEFNGLPRKFKDFPSEEEASSYLYGWLAGYFAADGCVDSQGLPKLASADRANLEFVERVCLRLGILTHGIREQRRLGFGLEDTSLFSMTFSRRTLTKEFFLLPGHRERWLKGKKTFERIGWVVTGVVSGEKKEEVFCAVVPETHSFALEGFILTGNCFSCGAGGDLVELVMHVREYAARSSARDWLESVVGQADARDLDPMAIELVVAPGQPVFRMPAGVENLPFDEWVSAAKVEAIKRGLEGWQVLRWGLTYALEGRLAGRFVIPVRDFRGVLRSYMARALFRQPRKYLYPRDEEGPDKDALFGEFLWPMDSGVRRSSVVVVTEGVFKSLAVERVSPTRKWQAAIGGSSIRPAHVAKLAEWGGVDVLMDADDAGERAGDELVYALGRHVRVRRLRLPEGKDADTVDPGALRELLES